jgi:hypothetical protein
MPANEMRCADLKATARGKLEDGHGKETRTTVLWVATGAAAAITTVVAVAFTDWSGEEAQETAGQRLRLAVGATDKSASLTLKGTF